MSRRRRKQQPIVKIAAMSIALLACIGGLVFAALTMPTNTPDRYGCFEGVDAPRVAVFVDASEPRWNAAQARSLRTYFDQLYGSLQFNERMDVYTTEGDVVASVMKPRFHVCGQASTQDQLKAINAPSGNEGYLRKQKERLYKKVLAPQLDALLALDPDKSRRQLNQSPVLESIKSVSRGLRAGDRLVVVSDMIQNSDSVRFCRVRNDMPPFVDFEKRTVYQRLLKPASFEGVDVSALVLQRYGYGQAGLAYCREMELEKFWQDYFKDNGAKNPRFIRIREGYAEDSQ